MGRTDVQNNTNGSGSAATKSAQNAVNKKRQKKKRKMQDGASDDTPLTEEKIASQPEDETLVSMLTHKFNTKSVVGYRGKRAYPAGDGVTKKGTDSTNTDYHVHDIRFIAPPVKAINQLAYDKCSKLLALSREDGSIEILNLKSDFQVKQVLPASGDRSTECMLWCKGCLYTASLHGEIIKWDLGSLSPAVRYDSYGGAVWCLALSNSEQFIAAGCEDGSVRIFQTYNMLAWEEQGLQYIRHMDPQEGRVLSVAWSHNDSQIVAGGVDSTIRVYKFHSGKAVSRITCNNLVDRNTLIWSVHYLKDGTIVTGDSLGNVQFWDGRLCTLKQTLTTHKADILTMCVNQEENVIYASGIDSRIARLTKVQEKLTTEGTTTTTDKWTRWVNSGFKSGSRHDIRSLVYVPDFQSSNTKKSSSDHDVVIATGIDPRLYIFPELRKRNCREVMFPTIRDSISLAKEASIVCHREGHTIDLWQLTAGQLGDPPKLIITMNTRTEEHILAQAISHDGRFVAYSTASVCRLFLLSQHAETLCWSVRKALFVMDACSLLEFTPDGRKLISLNLNGAIHVADLSGIGENGGVKAGTQVADIVHEAKVPKDAQLTPHWSQLCVSSDSKMFAVYGRQNVGAVFQVDSGELVSQIPSVEGHVASMQFKPDSQLLFILTNSINNLTQLGAQVRLYDLDTGTGDFGLIGEQITHHQLLEGRITKHNEVGKKAEKMPSNHRPINRIIFSRAHPAHMFFHSNEVLGKVAVDAPLVPAEQWQQQKEMDILAENLAPSAGNRRRARKQHFAHKRSILEWKNPLFVDCNEAGELVVVSTHESLDEVILDRLPAALKVKKFGS